MGLLNNHGMLLVFFSGPALLTETSLLTHNQALLIYSMIIIGITLAIHERVGQHIEHTNVEGGEH